MVNYTNKMKPTDALSLNMNLEAVVAPKSDKVWQEIKTTLLSLYDELIFESLTESKSINFTAYNNESKLEKYFKDEKSIFIILRGKNNPSQINGFTFSIPDKNIDTEALQISNFLTNETNTHYICATKLDKRLQGKKIVALMMSILESTLKKQGVEYVTRHAKDTITPTDNRSYADKIQSNYPKEKILFQKERESKYGKQRYFLIKIS